MLHHIMVARKWMIALPVAMATSACSKVSDQKQGEVFRACYERCMAPPKGECQPEHETCLVLCREGRDPIARVMPHLRSGDEPAISGRSRLSHSVRIETIGGVATPLIDKCVQLPFEAMEVFSTAADNQRTVNAHLVAGELAKVDEDQSLGHLTFGPIGDVPRGVPQVEVRFRVERNGALVITAAERGSRSPLQVTTVGR
jgi:hypothetical protein